MSEQPMPAEMSGRPADTGLDIALERLAEIADLPPAERVRRYDEVHGHLARALADPAEGSAG